MGRSGRMESRFQRVWDWCKTGNSDSVDAEEAEEKRRGRGERHSLSGKTLGWKVRLLCGIGD